MYFTEFSETNNIKALLKVSKYIENLIFASKEQNFSYLLCRCLILKANIELIQDNYSEALKILEDGLEVSEEHQKEKQIILRKIEEIKNIQQENEIINNHQSILDDSLLQLSNSLKFSFNRVPKIIPFNALGVMIINNAGLPVYSNFLENELKKNHVIISGLISAITSFASNILKQKEIGELKCIKHEKINILLENQDDRLIVLIVDKDTFDLRNRMIQFNYQAEIIKPQELVIELNSKKKELDALFYEIFEISPDKQNMNR